MSEAACVRVGNGLKDITEEGRVTVWSPMESMSSIYLTAMESDHCVVRCALSLEGIADGAPS